MTPTLSPTERRDLMTVLEWCGPDMVEWGLLAWGNRPAPPNGWCQSSRCAARWFMGYSCFVGEMAGGEPDQLERKPIDALRALRAPSAMYRIYGEFERPDWRTAARPIIEDWLARQRGADG